MNLATLRRFKPQLVALAAALTLAACVAPTTERPNVTDTEWQQEMAAQERAAKQAPIHFNAKKNYGKNQVEALALRLAPIASRVERAAGGLCTDLHHGTGDCSFKVALDPHEHGLNAHADGQNVVIYPAMVDFARNDNQLAFVIAHEFAHNIMGHVAATQQNVTVGALLGTALDIAAGSRGYNTKGAFGKFGGQEALLHYSPSFEAEADYVGLYILARAGFMIEQAPDFWRMMSQAEPDAIYISQTHPNNPSRTIAMTKTVAEIRAKQRAHQPLLPNIHLED